MSEYNGMEGEFLSNLDEVRYAKQLGMDSTTFHVTYNTESLYMIATSILHMKKPVYFHCYVSLYYYYYFLFFLFSNNINFNRMVILQLYLLNYIYI